MQKNTTNPSSLTPLLRDPFQSLFGRLFGDTLQEFYGAQEANTAPRTNIGESDQSYELSFELPGLDEKDIQVHVQDHVLTVRAERKDERESQGKRWHRIEHRYGQFTRTISLPHDAAANGVDAVYKQGVLTVTVPKQPESRPTKITVKAN
ncbi:MAG: Hsp20/alpha crystallin family protein [Planctomycetes bacterium]|nr:Hsp20/alpha crystallin family protein [Planctomycetota bacterium]